MIPTCYTSIPNLLLGQAYSLVNQTTFFLYSVYSGEKLPEYERKSSLVHETRASLSEPHHVRLTEKSVFLLGCLLVCLSKSTMWLKCKPNYIKHVINISAPEITTTNHYLNNGG